MGIRWALVLALLLGCYRSHEVESVDRPDAARPDAAPPDPGRDAFVPRPRDFGPDRPDRPDLSPPRDGVYWTLEPRSVFLSIPNELGCLVHEGGRVTVRVDFFVEDECEHAGPVVVDRAGGGTFLVRGFVWERHDPDPEACLGITWQETRHVHVEVDEAGEYSIEDAGGSSTVRARVMADRGDGCGAGAEGTPCEKDCQCADGLVCIAELGDFVECHGGRCQRPCDEPNAPEGPVYAPHLDCPSLEACADRGALAAPTCGPIEGDGCAELPSHCGPGTFCPPTAVASECVWGIELSARVRHPCRSDAECSEGLHCVEHEDGERRCEVPCFSHRMRCPPMHACSPSRWVCEWLGE